MNVWVRSSTRNADLQANGTQPIWAFDRTEPEGTAQVAIAYGEETSSNLLLPVVPGLSVPTGLPPCPEHDGTIGCGNQGQG